MESDLLARKEGEEDDDNIDVTAHARLLEEGTPIPLAQQQQPQEKEHQQSDPWQHLWRH